MSKLAIMGGNPIFNESFSSYNSITEPEIQAVVEVMKSGSISGFYGSWSKEFFGGEVVQAFEKKWSETFKVKHSISVNSATSGLIAAMGAIGLSPGQEVIVPPYSMSASVIAPLFYGGIPRFVDIESDTFCLDLEQVKHAINSKTKAILAVNLFGHPAHLKQLRELANQQGIYLIEDNAQGPLSSENKQYSGTIGHIGVFSLNYHKHIHTGEGGVCVTQDDKLAQNLQLIRNHGENAVEDLNRTDLTNLIGFNFRLTEIQAAIGLEQLKQIKHHVHKRLEIAQQLSTGIQDLPGLTPPKVRKNCNHVYYVWAMKYDEKVLGISREIFSKALTAEGVPHFTGYVKPLYLLPVFQKKIAIGSAGYPFNLSNISYDKGLCPISEQMHEKQLMAIETCAYHLSSAQVDLVIKAIHKIYQQKEVLRNL